MSVFLDPVKNIADLISAQTGYVVTEAHLSLGVPSAIAESKNTAVLVTMNPGAPVTGSKQIKYDRLNLADLSFFKMAPLTVNEGESLHDILARLHKSTGITFTASDLEDTVPEQVGGKLVIKLDAKSGSIGWIGEFNYPCASLPDISTAFNGNILPGFQ